MLKYLIVQLSESSTSYCHYDNLSNVNELIPLEQLSDAIIWSMKENLTLQFIYPSFQLPEAYKSLIKRTEHADIVPSDCQDTKLLEKADVVVINRWSDIESSNHIKDKILVIRTTFSKLIENESLLKKVLPIAQKVNLVITDIHKLTNTDREQYEILLSNLVDTIATSYDTESPIQFNALTDRLILDNMNNCNAGYESVTLAPDGQFYVCPAFYIEKSDIGYAGNMINGVEIKNSRLYRIENAPICRECDAWQCRRCVWLNRKTTLEVNTPSHEQCVASHIERNISRKLLTTIRKVGNFMEGTEIPELTYSDPFDKIMKLKK